MADNSPLNDPELSRLEQRLKSVTLCPTPRQREQLLYACGQAVGRAQMRRRVQAAAALTVLLTCVSASLSFMLFTRDVPRAAPRDAALWPHLEGQWSPERTDVLPRAEAERDEAQGPRLTASTSLSQLLAFDREHKAGTFHAAPLALASKRILTIAGPFPSDDL
jgi:hypothetical protein